MHSSTYAFIRYSIVLLTMWGITGCSPKKQAAALWHDYQSRLERVLGTEADETAIDVPYFEQPLRRAWKSQAHIGLLDLTRLGHCRLGNLIASQNSSLGKVAAPSVYLTYHLEFIKAAPACIQTLGDPELAGVLEKELQSKRQQAAEIYTWFLENDPLIRKRLFVGSSTLQADTGKAGLNGVVAAFSSLALIKGQIARDEFERIDTTAINEALIEINQSDFVDRYMAGMNVNLQALSSLNSFLSQQPEMRCKPGHNAAKQEILLNVLNKFFLGRIQAYLGLYNEAQFTLGSTMVSLFEGTQWQNQLSHYFDDAAAANSLKQQIRIHISIWQRLQQSCALEIKPGAAGRRPG